MKINHILKITSYFLYGASLLIPAMQIGPYPAYGLPALLIGWMTLNISWLANLVLFYVWKNIDDYKKVRVASTIAIVLGLSILLYDKLPYLNYGLFKFELTAGYFLWITSMFVCLFIKFDPKENVDSEEVLEDEFMPMFKETEDTSKNID